MQVSNIVDWTQVGELKRVMGEASASVTGRPMSVSASGPGVDAMEPEVCLDVIEWVQARRCPAHLERMMAWEARVGTLAIGITTGGDPNVTGLAMTMTAV